MPEANNGYVDHPRYGAAPRFTGLDPDMSSMDVLLHYRLCRYSKPVLEAFRRGGWAVPKIAEGGPYPIPGTAIAADSSRQTPATVPVTHYYDEERRCVDCHRQFLFFAEEQRHWYEELHFPIDADCVRCYPCRRRTQDVERTKRRYDDLVASVEPTADQQASLALYRLALVQAGRFHSRQLDHVRAFLNRFPDHPQAPDIRHGLSTITPQPTGANKAW